MHTLNALLGIALATSSLACEGTFQNVLVVDVAVCDVPLRGIRRRASVVRARG